MIVMTLLRLKLLAQTKTIVNIVPQARRFAPRVPHLLLGHPTGVDGFLVRSAVRSGRRPGLLVLLIDVVENASGPDALSVLLLPLR